jgi:hypothetical protein
MRTWWSELLSLLTHAFSLKRLMRTIVNWILAEVVTSSLGRIDLTHV